jgi:hypothetical protein
MKLSHKIDYVAPSCSREATMGGSTWEQVLSSYVLEICSESEFVSLLPIRDFENSSMTTGTWSKFSDQIILFFNLIRYLPVRWSKYSARAQQVLSGKSSKSKGKVVKFSVFGHFEFVDTYMRAMRARARGISGIQVRGQRERGLSLYRRVYFFSAENLST